MDTRDITYLTFDCYGTLIDWEAGILAEGLPRLPPAPGGAVDPVAFLRAYVRHEAAVEAGPYQRYRAVLTEAFRRAGEDLGATPDGAACAAFAAALPGWPPFPDAVAALARLAARFRLVVLSNVDDDLFAGTDLRLGRPFHAVVTAQQVGSYKPAPGHFRAARERLGLEPARWVHVAQSLYHDHLPAKALGLRTIHVDRPSRLAGTGLAPPAQAAPDARVTTLDEVVALLGA